MEYKLNILDYLIKNNGDIEINSNTIIDSIKESVFHLNTEEETRFTINKYQTALLALKKTSKSYEACDEILFFIETYFNKYVDDNHLISDLGRLNKINELNGFLIEIKDELKANINEELFQLLSPLLEIENRIEYTISSSKYICKFWKNWILDCKTKTVKSELESSLIVYLVLQNFNSVRFYNFLIRKIYKELSTENDPYSQEYILLTNFNKINILSDKTGHSFCSEYPNLRLVLIGWFKLEIKKCKKKQINYNARQTNIFTDLGCKIDMSLSVAQIAFMFKLFYESGIIINKSQTDILHVLSEKLCSKKTESISFESLRKKYYSVEDSTKITVKEVLHLMLSNI